MKKHYFFDVYIELLALNGFAKIPENFRYQSVARSLNGEILTNNNVGIRIEIFKGGEGDTGTIIFTEIHDITTNKYGLITLNIGEGNVVFGNFSTISWESDDFYAKIELDETGGNNSL